MASSCHQCPPGLARGRWEVLVGKCFLEQRLWKPELGGHIPQCPHPSGEMTLRCVSLLLPRGLCWHWALIAYRSSLLDNTSLKASYTVCLSFPPLLCCSHASVSWDYLQNKLLESFSRSLLLGEFKRRHCRTGEDKLVTWFWFAWDGGIPGMRDFQCQSLENLVKTGISWPPLQENSVVSGKLGDKKASRRKRDKADVD